MRIKLKVNYSFQNIRGKQFSIIFILLITFIKFINFEYIIWLLIYYVSIF